MNKNDLRANAYINALKSGNSDTGKKEKSEVKPFIPPRVQSKSENKQKNENQNQENKPLFRDVNKKVGKILETQATDYLKSGGLIKVPVADKQSDGKDSVYRRVAKFLLIIGVDEAAKILPHLSEEQTERIIPEIASIRNVDPDEAEVILAEFKGLLEKSRESGGKETARSILDKAYGPERAEVLLNKAAPFAGTKPFEYLNDADTERVFYLLNDESEQIRALVLSYLEPKKAAGVINMMDGETKKEVVKRLAKMEPVSPDILRRIDQAMHEKSLAQTTSKAENIDGRNALAEILKKMSPDAEKDILHNLAEDDPELGQDLRSRLFTYEDVVNADDRFIQEQLREMDDVTIAMLITGKPDDFVEKILSCISAGRRASVRDEQSINAPYKRSDVERITSSFFSVLRRAFEEGRLIIKGRNDEVYV